MYTGVSNFNLTATENEFLYMVYNEEDWVLDYDFNTSQNINLGIGVNIVQKPSFQTKLSGSYSRGNFKSSHTAKRENHNNVLTSYAENNYSIEFINASESGIVNHTGKEFSFSISLCNQFRVYNNFWVGPTLGWYKLNRYTDYPELVEGYVAETYYRGVGTLETSQLFIGIALSQKIDRFSFNLNISQSLFSTDANRTVDQGLEKAPTSMNIDFRYPTILEAGVSVSFFQQKNGCGTCPNW